MTLVKAYDNLGIDLMACLKDATAHAQGCLRHSMLGTISDVDTVNATIQVMRRALTSTFPRKIPQTTTILLFPRHIFVSVAQQLSLRDRLIFARTCRHIRKALYSSPTLWNRLCCDIPWSMLLKPNQTNRMVKVANDVLLLTHGQGKPIPLELSVAIPAPNLTTLESHEEKFLRLHIKDCSSLSLLLKPHIIQRSELRGATRSAWRRLSESLMYKPAPHMRSLTLRVRSAPGGRMSKPPFLPNHLLFDIASLQRLTLEGVQLHPTVRYLALSQLSSLSYSLPYAQLQDADIISLLFHLPTLESLGLEFRSFSHVDSARGPFARPIPSQRLRSVALARFGIGTADLLQFFKNVPVLSFRTTRITPSFDATHLNVWPGDNDIHIWVSERQLRIDGHSYDERTFTFHIPTIHRLSDVPIGQWHPVMPLSHAHRVTTMTVHEIFWAGLYMSSMTVLPNLAELRICLATCYEHRWFPVNLDVEQGCLFLWYPESSQHGPGSMFPRLRRMQMVSGSPRSLHDRQAEASRCSWRHGGPSQPNTPPCSCVQGSTISLADVAGFLGRLLSPGHKLDRLDLCGIDHVADVDLAVSLLSLSKVVIETHFESNVRTDVVDHCKQSLRQEDWGIPQASRILEDDVENVRLHEYFVHHVW